jgi:hypothetical protein
MCSVALLSTLLIPATLATQEPAMLEQRMRQLETLRRTAAAAVQRADSLRRETFDTVVVGSLVVLGRPSDAGLIQAAAHAAWARLDSLYGDAAAQLTQHPMLFFQQGTPIHDSRPAIAGLQRVMAPLSATTSDAAFQLVRAGSATIRTRTDGALADWLGAQLLADAPLTQLESRVYVELITAPSSAVRRCYRGALDACSAALGLDPGDPPLVWYDTTERRALVREQMGFYSQRRPVESACVAGSDSACVEAMHGMYVPPPLSAEARQTLVRVALATGGRGAFRRLMNSAGQPLPRRLEIAAGRPLNAQLEQWRTDVIAARPRPVTLSATIGWTALAWSLLFGFLALRSTRWR